MAKLEELPTEERVRRQVGRTIANLVVLGVSLAVLGGWASTGVYQLEPGQAAVILRLGRYSRTVAEPGLKWHVPPPLESHEVLNVAAIEREDFGAPVKAGEAGAPLDVGAAEAAMQTSDNNVVYVGFAVQYRIQDAFLYRYRVASPRTSLRDASEAAVREVVARTDIDGVLSAKRGQVELEARELLQEILDRYETGLEAIAIQLQEVQPPGPVRDAFDDVIAAAQDKSRATNEAQGYANEVVPRARGEASELRAAAEGYRDAKVAEAQGHAQRFVALVDEYQRAPEVTRKRLYLETMEEILPEVEKVIVEPGTAVVPYLPLGRDAETRR